MSIESTSSIQPAYCGSSDQADNGHSDVENSNNEISPLVKLVVAAGTAVLVGGGTFIYAMWRRSVKSLESKSVNDPAQAAQALQTTLEKLKKVSACLTGDQKKFNQEFAELPEDIRIGFTNLMRTPLSELPKEDRDALDKLKESDEYPLIVKSCDGIANPEQVALGKIFFEFKMKSIEEALKG